jgi:hypothetical protein
MMVVLLPSLESLVALPLPTRGGAAGAAVLLPRPIPPTAGVWVTFRGAGAPLLAFAFSTMFVRIPAAPPGGAGGNGLRGETGRARCAFPGVVGRLGVCGNSLIEGIGPGTLGPCSEKWFALLVLDLVLVSSDFRCLHSLCRPSFHHWLCQL